jgi:hypothetical protein
MLSKNGFDVPSRLLYTVVIVFFLLIVWNRAQIRIKTAIAVAYSPLFSPPMKSCFQEHLLQGLRQQSRLVHPKRLVPPMSPTAINGLPRSNEISPILVRASIAQPPRSPFMVPAQRNSGLRSREALIGFPPPLCQACQPQS